MLKAIPAAIALLLLAALEFSVAADVDVETILSDLDRPTGVAVRPGGAPEAYELFVAECGSGRVLRTSSTKPHESVDVITGLPMATSDERRAHPLLFLDERRLIVGVEGGPPDVRLIELKEGNTAVTADSATQKVAIELQPGADAATGRCIGLARTRANDVVADMVLVAFGGDDPLNGVWKLPVRAGMLSTLSPLGESSNVVADKPTALAVSEQGYLLIATASADDDKALLLFANPTNGQAVLSIETSLSEVFGLAYSPKTGQLYALADNEDGSGLFRIDDASKSGKPDVSESKVADIPRAMALVFGPDGALYVTALGDEDESSEGVVLRISGDL